jgi:3-phenylpropionate/trans-cinnamate dioxygenase ferredoxin reductase component
MEIAVPQYDYIIIGGGMTAEYAVRGIRRMDSSGTIAVISEEQHPPYKRPPLSKALWKGEPLESIWLEAAKADAHIFLSRTATRIDAGRKVVVDDHGATYGYRKLLLATGGRVRTLPFDVEGIIYFRTLGDYHALRRLTNEKESFIVVGGGFTGSEIAAALAMIGKTVTLIFPDEAIGQRVYPPRLSQFLNSYFESKGVRVLSHRSVTGITREEGSYRIKTSQGEDIVAGAVVAGVGILPNMELAQVAGLTVGNGVLVNEQLQTSQADIYAAGDVAEFYSPALGKNIRMEHEDNAKVMGEHAGRNMAGSSEPYRYLPYFYSDLFELGYEAVGRLSSTLEIVEDWKEDFHEGVVYYLEHARVVGVLLWNTWGQLENARALIGEPGPFSAATLKGKLPSAPNNQEAL